MFLELVAFVSDEDLFLVGRPDDVALGADSDEVILAEKFPDQPHLAHLRDYPPHIDALLGYRLDDIVIVALKVLHVLTRHTVLDEIIVPLYAELSKVLARPLGLPQIENIRQLLLFAVILDDPPSFFFAQQAAVFLVQPALIVIQHTQIFDHFDLVIVIS